jgi:hypothetical protein
MNKAATGFVPTESVAVIFYYQQILQKQLARKNTGCCYL